MNAGIPLPNLYPGKCGTCGVWVPKGAGTVRVSGRRWIIACPMHGLDPDPAPPTPQGDATP